MIKTFLTTLMLLSPMIATAQSTEVVKMSTSGICHAPTSSYYDRTKNFTAFETLQMCLDAGGRLPKK